MNKWTLAGYLAQTGFLWQQSEVLCTHGLAYLLEDPAASAALAALLSDKAGADLPRDLVWAPEVSHADRGRVDLEGQLDDRTPVVEIEAKLDASLAPAQLRSYASHVASGAAADPVLAVLVPSYRREEATKIIDATFRSNLPGLPAAALRRPVATAVISWEEVFEALDGVLSGSQACDAVQLRGMYATFTGDFRVPSSGSLWQEHEAEFVALVDRASRRLFDAATVVFPMSLEPSRVGGYGYRRRYAPSRVSRETALSIGVRDPFEGHMTPIWLRYHCKTPGFQVALKNLRSSRLVSDLVAGTPHAWLPLEVLSGQGADCAVDDLVRQAEVVDLIAAGLA